MRRSRLRYSDNYIAIDIKGKSNRVKEEKVECEKSNVSVDFKGTSIFYIQKKLIFILILASSDIY